MDNDSPRRFPNPQGRGHSPDRPFRLGVRARTRILRQMTALAVQGNSTAALALALLHPQENRQ